MSLWNTNPGTRGWSSGHISRGILSPRWSPHPSLLCSGQWLQCDMGDRTPLPGQMLVTAWCPAGHSCSWDQQPSLGSGHVPPRWCKRLFPSPPLCVGLIWISFSIPFVPGKMKLPKSPKFMFSRPFIIYNSILLVFKPNNPNLSMHLFSLCFCHVFSAAGAELREGVPPRLQVTLPSWEWPQGSEALANASNEPRSSWALQRGANFPWSCSGAPWPARAPHNTCPLPSSALANALVPKSLTASVPADLLSKDHWIP